MSRRRRRVVITGLGVVAPNGIGKDEFWKNLVAGHSAVDYITAFDPTPYPCKVAAEVKNFRPEEFMHPRRTKHRGRFSQFAVAAAKLAVVDAALTIVNERPDRVMACLGTATTGLGDVYETAHDGFDQAGMAGVPQTTLVECAAHAPVSHVSMELGLSGQAITLGSACVVGLDTVQWAYAQISSGNADIVFSGSTDAPIFFNCFATMCASKSLSQFSDPPTAASRPYDLRRDGLVLGEGAVIYVIEELEHALARSARIYSEVLGFGTGNEGGRGTRVDAGEIVLSEAIRSALEQASLSPRDIDYVNAHGNAVPDYDVIETRAFKRAFGSRAYNIPISSIKSMIGHAMGAGSAFQVAAACLALHHGILPPTINLETWDPECDLDYVPNNARTARIKHLLINAHAMGGTHSVLVLGQPR